MLGGLMLFRTPRGEGLDIPLWTVGSLSFAAALIMAFLTTGSSGPTGRR